MRHEIEKMIADIRAENSNTHPANDLYSAGIVTGRYDVINKLDAILATSDDDYKRGVVDGMTASANFVADDHLQGRDNDRMRLADSLRDEAKRVEQEK